MTDNFEYHDVVDILLFNSKSQLALTKRSQDDKSFPGHWDFSAGGHIDPGETADIAAKKELFEEIGVVSNLTFVESLKLKYNSWNSTTTRLVNASIYKLIYDGDFNIQLNEINNIAFFTLDEVQSMIDSGQKFHPEFLLVWKSDIISQK